jgi:hypothetical protein
MWPQILQFFRTLLSALHVIATSCAIGAFVGGCLDFWLGKRGQLGIKDRLETWWLKLSYVNWENLGKEEALFAVQVIDQVFGQKLLSKKRIITTISLTIVSLMLIATIFLIDGLFLKINWLDDIDELFFYPFLIAICSVPLSFALTRFIATCVVRMIVRWPRSNIVGLFVIFATQYLMLIYWSPIVSDVHTIISFNFDAIGESSSFREFIQANNLLVQALIETYDSKFTVHLFYTLCALSGNEIDNIEIVKFINQNATDYAAALFLIAASALLTMMPNLIRLCLTIFFIASFFLKYIKDFIMTLLGHMIEDGRPIYTLLFSGTATLTAAIQQIFSKLLY